MRLDPKDSGVSHCAYHPRVCVHVLCSNEESQAIGFPNPKHSRDTFAMDPRFRSPQRDLGIR